MHKRLALLFAVMALVAVPAASATDSNVGPAGLSTRAAPFDQQFIDMMAAHHAMAIDMAKMAAMHSTHPEVKILAKKIIAAQSREVREFHALRKRWYASATFRTYGGSEMMMRSMGMSGGGMTMNVSRFDFAFLSAMIPHHAGAITMARWETQSGTHPLLKKIAAKIIRDQAKEIGEMIGWRVSWYGA